MKAKPSASDPAELSAALLTTLGRAGADGLKTTALRLAGKSPAALARREALTALVKAGSAGTLGTGTAMRYFLAEHLPTAASVAARLRAAGAFVAGVASTPPTLWKAAELRRKLPRHEHALFDAAMDHLQAARQVVPLRHGRSVYVAFAGPLRVWLEDDVAEPPSLPSSATETDDAALFFTYTRLVRESGGFPDVKIAALQHATGGTAIAERLVALWREGRATLSLGDWSLADAPTREAAVSLDGDQYLLVRLEG